MSNRSRMQGMPRPPNPTAEKIAGLFGNMVEKKRQQDEHDRVTMLPPEELPKPHKQTVNSEKFEWEWLPLGDDRFIVWASFYRIDHRWSVEFNCQQPPMVLLADEAKNIGDAMLAAYSWKDKWKIFFADYMLGEPVPEPHITVVEDDPVATYHFVEHDPVAIDDYDHSEQDSDNG